MLMPENLHDSTHCSKTHWRLQKEEYGFQCQPQPPTSCSRLCLCAKLRETCGAAISTTTAHDLISCRGSHLRHSKRRQREAQRCCSLSFATNPRPALPQTLGQLCHKPSASFATKPGAALVSLSSIIMVRRWMKKTCTQQLAGDHMLLSLMNKRMPPTRMMH